MSWIPNKRTKQILDFEYENDQKVFKIKEIKKNVKIKKKNKKNNFFVFVFLFLFFFLVKNT